MCNNMLVFRSYENVLFNSSSKKLNFCGKILYIHVLLCSTTSVCQHEGRFVVLKLHLTTVMDWIFVQIFNSAWLLTIGVASEAEWT